MANTFKILYRGAAPTSSTTLYTTPASTNTLITTFIISNTTAADQTFTITAGGQELASGSTVAPNDSTIIEFKTLMDAADTITAFASSASVKFHVTGLEIS